MTSAQASHQTRSTATAVAPRLAARNGRYRRTCTRIWRQSSEAHRSATLRDPRHHGHHRWHDAVVRSRCEPIATPHSHSVAGPVGRPTALSACDEIRCLATATAPRLPSRQKRVGRFLNHVRAVRAVHRDTACGPSFCTRKALPRKSRACWNCPAYDRILFVSRGFLDDLLSALKRATLSVIGAAA